MNRNFKSYIIISLITLVSFAIAAPAFAQATEAAPAAPAQPKETAIYGEVQSVNAAAGTISIQYYDYDSDSEKTVEIAVGADAKLENAKTIADIRKGDWVDVTYAVSNGKNAAKMVAVEKEEPVAGTPAEE